MSKLCGFGGRIRVAEIELSSETARKCQAIEASIRSKRKVNESATEQDLRKATQEEVNQLKS